MKRKDIKGDYGHGIMVVWSPVNSAYFTLWGQGPAHKRQVLKVADYDATVNFIKHIFSGETKSLKNPYYAGHIKGGYNYEIFTSKTRPTEKSHGKKYAYVTGPFATREKLLANMRQWINRTPSGGVEMKKNPLNKKESAYILKQAKYFAKGFFKTGDRQNQGRVFGLASAIAHAGSNKAYEISEKLRRAVAYGNKSLLKSPRYKKNPLTSAEANQLLRASSSEMRNAEMVGSDTLLGHVAIGKSQAYKSVARSLTAKKYRTQIEYAARRIPAFPSDMLTKRNPLTVKERKAIERTAAEHERDSRKHKSTGLRKFDAGTAAGLREAIAMSRKNPGGFKNVREYRDYLEYTLIPDLKGNGEIVVPAMLERLLSCLKKKKLDGKDYIAFLKAEWIRPMHEKGHTELAHIIEAGVKYLYEETR